MEQAAGDDVATQAHPTHGWGGLLRDPWADIAPDNGEWATAVRRTWLRDGGSEEGFLRLFPDLAAKLAGVGVPGTPRPG